MSLAMVAAGFASSGSRLKSWIRWLLLTQVLTAFGQVGWSMFGLNTAVFIVTSLVWVIGAPLAFALLAIMFRRAEPMFTPERPMSPVVWINTIREDRAKARG
jgi:hypothetical protein